MLDVHGTDGPPEVSSRAGFHRRFGVLLALLVLARGVVLLCALPPFEGWDEYQHVAYVQHLHEGGRTPVVGETRVPSAVLAEAVKYPQPGSAVRDGLGGVGGVGYQQFWADRLDGRTRPFRDAPVMMYQSQHGPLSYRMLQPVYAAFGGVDSVGSSIAGMRLLNLLLTAGAVAAAFFCLSTSLRERRAAAWVGLVLATYPLFLINGVRVANDALAVFLATLTVWLGLSLSARPWASPGRLALACLATGVLAGFAVLAKATNYALAPFLGFCMLAIAARPEITLRRSAGLAIALSVGFLAVTQAEMRFNLAHYGSISSMQEAAVNHSRGLGRADLLRTAMAIPWTDWIVDLWTRLVFFAGAWSFQGTHPKTIFAHRDLVMIGLLGWVWGGLAWAAMRRRGLRPSRIFADPRLPLACLVLVAGYTGALGYHLVQSKLAWGQWSTGAWYASAAMPWFLTLVVLGLMRWPLSGRLRGLAPLALIGTSIAAEILGVFGRMVPFYTGFARWPVDAERLASLQPAWLGLPTILAAMLVEVAALAALILILRDDARAERAGLVEPIAIDIAKGRGEGQRAIDLDDSRAAA
ncbi:glycosyltransferase family 39 protein [Paludisphaera soli]|uniref:glycosyltransferase family 39 protein n=1 Tax=Paludisphaera soli TaxID=2712865 RepID=UPI0013EB8AA1|nr:glycosyltransferase family 39 protein [Paludisphaera soli]